MPDFTRDHLVKAIDHSEKNRVKILDQAEVRRLIRGEIIITNNNVGDLIYE